MTKYIIGNQTFTNFADLCNEYQKQNGCWPGEPKKEILKTENGIIVKWELYY